MPFKESSRVEERIALFRDYDSKLFTVRELCRRYARLWMTANPPRPLPNVSRRRAKPSISGSDASASRASTACSTARPGRIHRQAEQHLPLAGKSKGSAEIATPRTKSQTSLDCRVQPSAPSSNAWVSACSAALSRSRNGRDMNVKHLARSFTSTLKNSGVSIDRDVACQVIARATVTSATTAQRLVGPVARHVLPAPAKPGRRIHSTSLHHEAR